MMRVAVNGTELHVTLAGDESRPALFLNHSLATTHAMWGLQMPLLARHFRVVAFDMRGHGASAAPAGPYTMDQLADDVVGLADHLGIKRFDFCGLSIGGMVGQALALRHGSRLGRMILSSTFTGPVAAEAQKGWDERIGIVKSQGTTSQIDGTMARWLSAGFQQAAPRTAQWIRDLIAETPAEGYAGCGLAIRDMKLTPGALAAIKVPTLVIAGEKDPGATPAEGERIAKAISGARLQIIPGGYHLCNIEFPHNFSEAMLAFLLGGDHG